MNQWPISRLGVVTIQESHLETSDELPLQTHIFIFPIQNEFSITLWLSVS